MCGIAGFLNKSGVPASQETIRSMTEAVRHRGPDGYGYYTSGNLALGHRRLAIIDLSEAANQPMHWQGGGLTIIFNGEIYNYVELRDELQRLGHRFATHSDTEVILAAYAQWGPECVGRFNGMWAFAIYDRQRNQLFCSRDRFGVKPFHYVNNERVFAFGSEIKQLLDFLPSRRANHDVMMTFLVTSWLDYSEEETFFEGINKLPAGHNLIVDVPTGKLECRRYYRLVGRPLNGLAPEQVPFRFLDLLSDAVSLRLRSDVPVGTCLSGGLDSSVIAALAAPQYMAACRQPFAAITALSIDGAVDEEPYARQVVKKSGLRWLKVRPTSADFVAAMPNVIYHQDEPIRSPSMVMQYFVMRTAREHATPVLLDGQGADETLLGYDIYCGPWIRSALRRDGVKAGIRAFQDALANRQRMSAATCLKWTVGLGLTGLRYRRARREVPHLHSFPDLPGILRQHAASTRDWEQFQLVEIGNLSLPQLLRYEDRNSMAFSIETRLPFLDYRLVEFCVGLPIQFKIREGWGKWVMRKAAAGAVPDPILWRKDKIGFEAPDAMWLNQEAKKVRQTVLGSGLVRSISHETRLRDSFDHLPLKHRWRLFALALWSEQFGVENSSAAARA